MEVPANHREWRDHVDYKPAKPRPLSLAELHALPKPERDAYDTERRAWISAETLIRTPDVKAIFEHYLDSRDETLAPGQGTSRSGVVVSGNSYMGKSSTLMQICREHERDARARRPTAPGVEDPTDFLPVVYFNLPATLTPRALMLSLAAWMGLPLPGRTTSARATEVVRDYLKTHGTTLVAIDELQKVRSHTQDGGDTVNALKGFQESVPAVFLYAGVNIPQSHLMRDPGLADQFLRRNVVYTMRGFSYPAGRGGAQLRAEWEDLLLKMEQLIPLADQRPGDLPTLAPDLAAVTKCSIGSLRSLLRKAANRAIRRGTERITPEILHSIEPNYPLTGLTVARPPRRVTTDEKPQRAPLDLQRPNTA
ncbi:MAG: TniB family NTP-binding protein [Actinobacteria bacterium]|nr:TniB family NTP-binding protein [Actinomycetota bacterium]